MSLSQNWFVSRCIGNASARDVGAASSSCWNRGSASRDLDREQRCVLLTAVKISVAEIARGHPTRDAELEGERVVAFEVADALDRAGIQAGEEFSSERARTLHALVASFVGEHDVERQREWSGVLTADQGRELREHHGVFDQPMSMNCVRNISS